MRWAWLAVLGAATAAVAAPRAPRDRFVAGDLEGLRRAVIEAPIAEATAGLRGDRASVHASLAGIAGHPDADLALALLAHLAGGWDRRRAAEAAAAGLAIADRLDGDRAILDDLADDDLAAAAEAWTAVARRTDRWSDVRAAAVAIAARLTVARAATAEAPPALDDLLAPLFADGDPEVRRAALEAVPAPAPPALRDAAAARVALDDDAITQAIAAAVACGDDPRAGLAALGDAGRAALRELAAAPPDRPGALLGLARCLAVDDDPTAARALATLRQRAPRALRATLAALARRP